MSRLAEIGSLCRNGRPNRTKTMILKIISREETRAERERSLNDAMGEIRRDYFDDVRDAADSIKDELIGRLKDGEAEAGDSLRNWLMERIDQTIDGSGRVIYTFEAQKGLLCTDNGGAYFDEFGEEGAMDADGINWSRLMYAAYRMDVIEQLESIGVDVNDPDATEYDGKD